MTAVLERESEVQLNSVVVPARPKAIRPALDVRRVGRLELTAEFLEAWRDLERRSCHSNAFLSPDFLIPAWRLLPGTSDAFLVVVRERATGRLLALGAFEERLGSRMLPAPHLVAARTMHTYRTGILLDASQAEAALEAMLRFLQEEGWHGVILPRMRLDSNLAQHLNAVSRETGLRFQTLHRGTSPAIFPPILTREGVEDALSSARKKSLRRNRQWLESQGPVRLTPVRSTLEIRPALEEFLRLENDGWKGEKGTSLLSSGRETQFFQLMGLQTFHSGRLILTRLRVGEQVAATAINFLAGNTLFAFKIAWNPEFAKGGPGMVHELELPFLVREQFPDVTCIDSCARPESYVASVWPHEIDVGCVVLGLTAPGRLLLQSLDALRSVRRAVGSRLRRS